MSQTVRTIKTPPACQLRWHNGVLQIGWHVQEINAKGFIENSWTEWQEVPVVNEVPAVNEDPS